MEIDFNEILTWLAWIGSIAILLGIIGGLFITAYKLGQLILITSVEQNTGKYSSTLLQRWVCFITLMGLLVMTHIEVHIEPFHVTPIALSELEITLLLAFIAGMKYLKTQENKVTPEPGNQPVYTEQVPEQGATEEASIEEEVKQPITPPSFAPKKGVGYKPVTRNG